MNSQRKDTETRQKEIVSAARELIVKYGSDQVTVKRLAEELGLTQAALYKHFRTKKDILFSLIDDIEATLRADLDNGIAHGDDPLQVLEQAIDRVQQRKGVSFHIMAEIISLGDAKLNDKIYRSLHSYIGTVKGILSEGVNRGSIREDLDLDAAAVIYLGMTQILVNLWALSRYRFNLRTQYSPLWALYRDAIEKDRVDSD